MFSTPYVQNENTKQVFWCVQCVSRVRIDGRRLETEMSGKIRVRFAPSPTGEPHVGNIRTAIFDWLLARRDSGEFIIRIEDTDQARAVEGTTEVILEALNWLGIDWDEGPDIGGEHAPYQQSQRLELYEEAVAHLLQSGFAYKCYCSPERLDEVRKMRSKQRLIGSYDRRCRNLSTDEQQSLDAESNAPPVVRFKMPLDGATCVNDLIRGEVTFENRLVDDFIMLKSDGFPTYHLAHMVDDHYMRITHVLRGEEWLPSVPRHIQLYKAMGWQPPLFAHLPIILAPDRAKLSKRHGATSLLDYRKMGYLPHTMLNFLTLLGWSLDDKTELFTEEALIEHFSIERVSKSAAIFNTDKLDWMNGHYIRQMSADELADALLNFWQLYPPPEIPTLPNRELVLQIVPLVRERLKTLSDAAALLAFLFKDDIDYQSEELVQRGMDTTTTRQCLHAAYKSLHALPSFHAQPMEDTLRQTAKEMHIKAGQIFGSLRVATTGQKVAPPLFQSMEVMGRERSLNLVKAAIERL